MENCRKVWPEGEILKNKRECLKCKKELHDGDKVVAIGLKNVRNSIRYICPECAKDHGIDVDQIKTK